MRSIPKVFSGLGDMIPRSLSAITELYRHVFDQVIPTASSEVAEVTKVYENCR